MNKRDQKLKEVLQVIQTNIKQAIQILNEKEYMEDFDGTRNANILDMIDKNATKENEENRIVEGVFNGIIMIDASGKEYAIPPNYASKSKLVEGDILKLTITPEGRFLYKQISPTERKRVIGILGRDEVADEYFVTSGSDSWKVLTASVTYFHGMPGDEAIIMVPKNGKSIWAAVENIIKGSHKVLEENKPTTLELQAEETPEKLDHPEVEEIEEI